VKNIFVTLLFTGFFAGMLKDLLAEGCTVARKYDDQ